MDSGQRRRGNGAGQTSGQWGCVVTGRGTQPSWSEGEGKVGQGRVVVSGAV